MSSALAEDDVHDVRVFGPKVYHRPLEKHSHETGRDGPQDLQQNTSISRVFVLGALVPPMLLAMVDSDFVNDGRAGQSDHSGKTALTPVGQAGKTFELFITRDFFTMSRSAKQRLCHNSANKHVRTLFTLARALRNRAGFQP